MESVPKPKIYESKCHIKGYHALQLRPTALLLIPYSIVDELAGDGNALAYTRTSGRLPRAVAVRRVEPIELYGHYLPWLSIL